MEHIVDIMELKGGMCHALKKLSRINDTSEKLTPSSGTKSSIPLPITNEDYYGHKL